MSPIGGLFFGTTKSDYQLLYVGYECQIFRPVWSVSCLCAISPWIRQTLWTADQFILYFSTKLVYIKLTCYVVEISLESMNFYC